MVSDIIKLGSKVDIRLQQQVRSEKQTGQAAQIFHSKICDVKEDGKIHMYMPMNGQKYVLLPLDLRYEFIFYTNVGLYRCDGKVTERYKSNNIYMIVIEVTSQLSKFQRREYYRYSRYMDIKYCTIDEEQALLPDIRDIEDRVEEHADELKDGFVIDISGGGVRFVSKGSHEVGEYLFMEINLESDENKRVYKLVGNVVECSKVEMESKKYQNRVQFVIKDMKVREDIIRFIFEQERKSRKKKG